MRKIVALCVVAATMALPTRAAHKPLDVLARTEKTFCYGDAYDGKQADDFCFVFVGLLGQPVLAAGSNWGPLTILHYMGTATYRGYDGKCQASYGGKLYDGKLWVDNGVIDNYQFRNKPSADSGTYCLFRGNAIRPLMEAIYRQDIVHVRLEGDREHRSAFGREGVSPKPLPEFFRLVRENTTASVPFDEYRGVKGILYRVERWLGIE